MPTVVSVCTACPQPRPAPHSTIRSEAEQSPTLHSCVSQMTFSMRLHQSSISTTILSTSLWPHMLVPISSYPTYPISNNPVSATLAFNYRRTSQNEPTSPAICRRCTCANGTTTQRPIVFPPLIDPEMDTSWSPEAGSCAEYLRGLEPYERVTGV